MPIPLHFWKKTPALRWLIPFAGGIYLSDALSPSPIWPLAAAGCCLLLLSLYPLLKLGDQFRIQYIVGGSLQLLVVCFACLLTWKADVRHDTHWIGRQDAAIVQVQLETPLKERQKTYSAVATVRFAVKGQQLTAGNGRVLLYFLKSDQFPTLEEGTSLWILKPLLPIPRTANPEGFDFQWYCFRKGITHQAFLSRHHYKVLSTKPENWLWRFVLRIRKQLLSRLDEVIHGKKERGLAAALLIGYEEDLDKDLVQSYSQTGVVHVIAISGMHLGLIYGFLLWATRFLMRRRRGAVLRLVVLLAFLWLFTLLAGAQPSVLRSAVMFSFVGAGTLLQRQASLYQSLALSALLLLAYNPYWLWDIGFQLSYLAVVSLAVFYRFIYRLIICRNKLADQVWKLAAGTMAVQLLTFPAVVYHFHQFPLLFLFTNMIVVPLSSLILVGEVLLLISAPFTWVSSLLGTAVEQFIYQMNRFVERTAMLPHTNWQGLSITVYQAMLLLVFISSVPYGLVRQQRKALYAGLAALLVFLSLRYLSFYEAAHQQRVIVYSVPGHQAIDLIAGRSLLFISDDRAQGQLYHPDFYTSPARIAYRIQDRTRCRAREFTWKGHHLFVLDRTYRFERNAAKRKVDLLVVSGNTRNTLEQVLAAMLLKQVVTDGSLPAWKTKQWQQQCDSLQIPFHDVKQNGGFVMNL